MLEKHRLNYLEHLGIDNYMPKLVLPNALASELLPDEALMEPAAFSTADLPSDISIPTTLDQPTVAPEMPASAPVDVMSQLLGDTPKQPVSDTELQISIEEKAKPEVSTPNLDTAKKAGETVRFSLNVWRIHQSLMVIDTRQPASALPTDRLLQNILRSIGYGLAQLPASDMLRWPLFKDDSMSHPEDEARAMVQAYISAQTDKAGMTHLLLLGHDAVRFSLDVGEDSQAFYEQHQGKGIEQSQWQCQALIAPSLVEMLEDPMKKRITWQAVQQGIRTHS